MFIFYEWFQASCIEKIGGVKGDANGEVVLEKIVHSLISPTFLPQVITDIYTIVSQDIYFNKHEHEHYYYDYHYYCHRWAGLEKANKKKKKLPYVVWHI